MKKDKAAQIFMYSLGALVVIGFFIIIFALITKSVPETNNDVLVYSLGALTSAFLSIVAFYYGSSQGSRDKTEMISKKNESDTVD